MNGQLSEQPLVELIREISDKAIGGRLRLERDKVKIVTYFDNGDFLYAAANVRTFRLREYLQKNNVVPESDLAQFNDRVSDLDLVKVLCAQKLLAPSAAQEIQAKQVSEILCTGLLWTEGSWEFDSKSRLNESLNLKIDAHSLLLDASRRLPPAFAASRFPDRAEIITPLSEPLIHLNLLPAEGYLLSRLDRPMPVSELVAITGVGEAETLGIVYSLALAGALNREHWKTLFDSRQAPAPPPPPRRDPEKVAPPPPVEQPRDNEVDIDEVERFLARIKSAQSHYEVLGVAWEVSPENLKNVYYQLARRYHPDRFRKVAPSHVTRIESAFARITQAYDTLRDDKLRAAYNSKLSARRRAEQISDATAKPASEEPQPQPVAQGVTEPVVSKAERAETQFKEGLEALELGQQKAAMGLFASAASAVPKEARYRAFYGQVLAANERTRRTAETELLAAIKLDPKNSDYRVMLAELYRDLGLKLRAKGEAERAVTADPNNKKARDLLRALK